jgi:radical SAM family uncharacterized protein
MFRLEALPGIKRNLTRNVVYDTVYWASKGTLFLFMANAALHVVSLPFVALNLIDCFIFCGGNLDNISDKILKKVTKPARYTGGEMNMAVKEPAKADARFCLCFPDIYEVGMSHLGSSILYHLVNERTNIYCERAYTPWVDMEAEMRKACVPLCSLETGTPLNAFDIIGFSLCYEMCYTNVLSMLDLSSIPLYAKDRDGQFPLVIAGGACAANPEPLAAFIDLFVIGEAEEVLLELLSLFIKHKKQGYKKELFLKEAAQIQGIYVPAFYTPVYNEDGTVNMIEAMDGAPPVIQKRLICDMEESFFPLKPIVPFLGIVHDRITLEIFRGCTRGCRFCQAGFLNRPIREKSVDKLMAQAREIFKNTGYDEISLCSLSSGDYSHLEELIFALIDEFEKYRVSVSLPSLRADTLIEKYAQKMKEVRKSGLTFAPEAGTQRLRDIINKNITEDDLLNNLHYAFDAGWDTVKLYFMIGLPQETEEDIEGIYKLVKKVKNAYYEIPFEKRKKAVSIHVSASTFVPKPCTPFQWEPQESMESVKQKQLELKQKLNIKGVKFSYHDTELSFLEAVFARGDRKLSEVLVQAYQNGARFDSWAELFDYAIWTDAFEKAGVDPLFYTARERKKDEVLPWSHISCGIDTQYLIEENQRALGGETTQDCRENCRQCGMQGVCFA